MASRAPHRDGYGGYGRVATWITVVTLFRASEPKIVESGFCQDVR